MNLLLESETKSTIEKAITEGRILEIEYEGSDHSVAGKRIVEPIALGNFNPKNKYFKDTTQKNGNLGTLALRAWARDGSVSSTPDGTVKLNKRIYGDTSSLSLDGAGADNLSKIEGYRLFFVKRMSSVKILDEKFDTRKVFIGSNRPRMNPSNDSDLNPIFTFLNIRASTIFDPEFLFEEVKVGFKELMKNNQDILKKLEQITFQQFKDSFYSENDYDNFYKNVSKRNKINKMFNFVYLMLNNKKDFGKMDKKKTTVIKGLRDSFVKYIDKGIKKYGQIVNDLKKIFKK